MGSREMLFAGILMESYVKKKSYVYILYRYSHKFSPASQKNRLISAFATCYDEDVHPFLQIYESGHACSA